MNLSHASGRRLGAGILTLVAAFAIAMVLPMPSLPDSGRAQVRAEVVERLPGWTVERLDPSWEGAYTVVTSCAGRDISFQFVPGHGLPASDAWLRPSDGYSRTRLDGLSDHYRYLIWYAHPRDTATLSCSEELARSGDTPIRERKYD